MDEAAFGILPTERQKAVLAMFERGQRGRGSVRRAEARLLPITLPVVIVQHTKRLVFIDGVTQRNEMPEKFIRLEITQSLACEYGQEKAAISVRFILRLESWKLRDRSCHLR